MVMENYKNNSQKAKNEESSAPKVKKIADGEIKQPKTLKGKIADTFIKEDRDSILDYILLDVVIPMVKDGIATAVTGAIQMALYGEVTERNNNRRYTNYSNPSSNRYNNRTEYNKRQKTSHDPSSVVLNSRIDAINVLNFLKERIDEYDMCTVADFYEAVGVTSTFTDSNYGWINLDSAYVCQLRGGGYNIEFPKPRYLE